MASSVKKLYEAEYSKGKMPSLSLSQEEWAALRDLLHAGFNTAVQEYPEKRQLYDKVADRIQAVLGTDPLDEPHVDRFA